MNFRTPSLLLKLNTYVRFLMEPPEPPIEIPTIKCAVWFEPVTKWLNAFGVDCHGHSWIPPEAVFPKNQGEIGGDNTWGWPKNKIPYREPQNSCDTMAQACSQYVVGYKKHVLYYYYDEERIFLGYDDKKVPHWQYEYSCEHRWSARNVTYATPQLNTFQYPHLSFFTNTRDNNPWRFAGQADTPQERWDAEVKRIFDYYEKISARCGYRPIPPDPPLPPDPEAPSLTEPPVIETIETPNPEVEKTELLIKVWTEINRIRKVRIIEKTVVPPTGPPSNIVAKLPNIAHRIDVHWVNGAPFMGDVRVYLNGTLLITFFDVLSNGDLGMTSGGAPLGLGLYAATTTFAESLFKSSGNIVRLEIDNEIGSGPPPCTINVYGWPKVNGQVIFQGDVNSGSLFLTQEKEVEPAATFIFESAPFAK